MKSCFSIFLLLISGSVFASDSSYIKFIFPDSLSVRKFKITVNDGITDHYIDAQHSWQGELFAPFGFMSIGYVDTDTSVIESKAFFRKGRIEVVLNATSIDEASSVNIIPYSKMGGDVFDAFIKERADSQMAFYHRHKKSFPADPTLLAKMLALSDSVRIRKIEFIKRFPDLKMSSWIFLTEIYKTPFLSPKKLMEFYNTDLPDEFKRSKAGDHVAGVIRSKIAVTFNGYFPDFSAVDISNNKIELSKLRGSYVLVQFWASWCAPCIEEMPELKSIYDKYGGPEFKLISFSIDKNLAAGRKAIEKYSMNWPQVMEDYRLYDSLAYVSIPQLYLIDKNGRAIYNTNTEADKGLVRLKKLLSELNVRKQ